MKKEETIRRYGEVAYEKTLQQGRDRYTWNREERKQQVKDWKAKHPEKIVAHNREGSRKGGKYYERRRKYKMNGIPGKRARIRTKHADYYRPYKKIIAPESQIHHEWIPGTAEYTGVALVEVDQHMRGFIDVIQILEGEIILFTEEEVREKIRAI